MKLIILGNGFDLDLGLHTRYSDFWHSENWKEAKKTCPEKYFIRSLEDYQITHNWFDLESGLLEGATRLRGRLNKNYDKINYYKSFQILIKELKNYILAQQENFIPNKNSVAEQIFNSIGYGNSLKCIYNFNYTDISKIIEKFKITSLPEVYHVHGSLQPDDHIILGIEVEDFASIPPQLTFLIKSNSPHYHYTHLLRDLENADDVIFFGHSINGMDFPYFKDYFMSLATLPTMQLRNKHITIITYDENSAMQIKDNFRRNGIDVRNLFNKVEMEFLLTKSVYDGNKREITKLDSLKQRLQEIEI